MVDIKENTKSAILCVTTRTIAATAACGGLKTLVPIPCIEVGALTAVTRNMCKRIAETYGYEGLSGISTLVGVVTGAALGANIATQVVSVVPYIGVGANMISTASLHLGTGAMMIVVFELMDEGLVSKSDINNEDSVLYIVNQLAGKMTSIAGKLFRGDFAGAMGTAKSAIDFSKPYITC